MRPIDVRPSFSRDDDAVDAPGVFPDVDLVQTRPALDYRGDRGRLPCTDFECERRPRPQEAMVAYEGGDPVVEGEAPRSVLVGNVEGRLARR